MASRDASAWNNAEREAIGAHLTPTIPLATFFLLECVLFWFSRTNRFSNTIGSPPFIPSIGLYLVAAMRFRPNRLPLVALCALAASLAVKWGTAQPPYSPLVLFIPWAANTVAVVLGAVTHQALDRRFAALRDRSPASALTLMAIIFLLVPFVSASLIDLLATLFRAEPLASHAWAGHFEADGLGILVLAPFALAMTEPRTWKQVRTHGGAACWDAALLLVVLLGALCIFGGAHLPAPFSEPSMALPLLVLASFRGRRLVSAAATFIVAVVVVFSSAHGLGAFASQSPEAVAIVGKMQLFLATATLMSILLTDAVIARQSTVDDLSRANAALTVEARSRSKAEERLALAVDAADLGVWEASGARATMTWSARCAQILGTRTDAAPSFQAFLGQVEAGDRERLEATLVRAETDVGGAARTEDFRLISRGDRPQVARIRCKSYVLGRDGGEVRLAGILQDVTGEVEAKAALRRREHDANRANQEKTRFLACMSHELRSPLGAMIGFADLMQDARTRPEERLQYAEMVHRNGQNLNEILDQILDLSKVEAGRLDIVLRPVSLHSLVADVLSLLNIRAHDKGLTLAHDIDASVPAYVETDPMRLRQILINAVGNAIKFTREGQIGVSLRAASDGRGRWQITFDVDDTGTGLSAAEQSRLFQPFSQANAHVAAAFGGTGLGLTLSRHLARLLGGGYELLRSEPGSGSTFRIMIDGGELGAASAAVPSEPAKRPAPQPALPLQGVKILVADDAPDNRFLVRRYLELAGAAVDCVDNGLNAVGEALTGRYDLVLMDIEMPQLSGFEALSLLKEKRFNGAVVALTGRTMGEEIQDMLRAGFAAHVSKPINREGLLRTLSGLLT